MRTAKSVLRHLLRAIIALLAIANLLALFLWSYRIPDNIRTRAEKIIYGDRQRAVEVLAPGEEAPAEPEEETPVLTARLMVPSQAINYSGGDLDLLDGLYVEFQDGSRDEDAVITYEIEDGSTRLDKIVNYTATLDDGQELTGSRTIRISSRYTDPTLTVTGDVPEVTMDDDIRTTVLDLISAGDVYAEDGFGNDITDQVQGRFDKSRNEEGETVYAFVLYVTNAVGDTAEVNLQDGLYGEGGTGVTMRLTRDEVTLNVGTPFYAQDYVSVARDSHGNDLTVQTSGSVNSYAVGDYSLDYWCVDADGKSSPTRTLKVHIV